VESFQEGLAKILVNKKFGYIDKTGQIVIKPQFESAESFEEGLARIKLNNMWGLIDLTGQIIVNPQFDDLTKSLEDMYIVKINDEIGILKKNGFYEMDTNLKIFINLLSNEYNDYSEKKLMKYLVNLIPLLKNCFILHLG
jgi:hypothetical protein